MPMVASIYMYDQIKPAEKTVLSTHQMLGSTLTTRSTVLFGLLSDL